MSGCDGSDESSRCLFGAPGVGGRRSSAASARSAQAMDLSGLNRSQSLEIQDCARAPSSSDGAGESGAGPAALDCASGDATLDDAGIDEPSLRASRRARRAPAKRYLDAATEDDAPPSSARSGRGARGRKVARDDAGGGSSCSPHATAAQAESDAAREKRLEKNRRSARRHRAKVRTETELLLERNAKLESAKAVLEAQLTFSERTIAQLRGALDAVLATRSAGPAAHSAAAADVADADADDGTAAAAALMCLAAPAPAASQAPWPPVAMSCAVTAGAAVSSAPGAPAAEPHVPQRLAHALTRLGLPETAPRTTEVASHAY